MITLEIQIFQMSMSPHGIRNLTLEAMKKVIEMQMMIMIQIFTRTWKELKMNNLRAII